MTTTPADATVPEEGGSRTMRQAQRADLLAVFRIEKAVFPQPWPFAAFERFLGQPGFLVATRGDAVTGYVVSDVTPNYGRDIGHVKDVAVHPEVQGEGIGRALLTRALGTLALEGAKVVKLEVRESNDRAKALYTDLGFEATRRVPGYYDDGEAALVMVVDVDEYRRHAHQASD